MATHWRSSRRCRTLRSAWNRTGRDLYLAERTMGDLSAGERDPKVLLRRTITRDFFATLRRL